MSNEVFREQDGYDRLAIAIIVRAAQDYHFAKKHIGKDPNDYWAQATIDECTNFFLSDWYRMLTRVDGRYLLDKLDELYDKQGATTFTTLFARNV